MKKKKTHKITIFLLLLIFFVVTGLLLYAFDVPIFPTQKENTTSTQKTDTTPPDIKCSVHSLTLKKGESLSLDRLSLRITDKSKIGEPFFSKITANSLNLYGLEENTVEIANQFSAGIEMKEQTYTFPYGGKYELLISVMDEWKNEGTYALEITVEEPPQLTVFSNFYIAKGNSAKFEDYVSVWDFLDTECTNENVIIDTSQLNITAAGTYPITFTAKDSYGLSTSVTASVMVCPPEEIQELIYSHTISIADSGIIGISNPYDAGYYKENDSAFNESILLPATITFQRTNGAWEKGFLLEITDTYVLICTLADGVPDTLTKDITFFDGTVKKASVTTIDSAKNLAFLQIPISKEESMTSITFEETKKLRTIHIDEAFWAEICDFLLPEDIPLSEILELYERIYEHKLAVTTDSQ